MAIIYDWREFEDAAWEERYPRYPHLDDGPILEETRREIIGAVLWREFAHVIEEDWNSEANVRFLDELGESASKIRGRQGTAARKIKDCVFISHSHKDGRLARDLAQYIDSNCSIDVWLDVWDPSLAALNRLVSTGQASKRHKAVAIARIIEMALANSTHVLAVMTSNSKSSRWIPYEYGRVKRGVHFAAEAAAWLDSETQRDKIPDYMLLGSRFGKESQLVKWLA